MQSREREEGFTPSQIARARLACRAQSIMGHPSNTNMAPLVKMNSIYNYAISRANIGIASCLFGPNFAALRGKTVQTAPWPAVSIGTST